jgi:plastocyanin
MRTSTNRRRAFAVSSAALAAAAGMLVTSTAASAAAFGLNPAAATAPIKKAPTKAAVPIKDNAYMPQTLTVKLGEAVVWTNMDKDPHTVTTTRAPVAFDSGVFKKGQSFSYTFTTPGTYTYYCAVHPDMVAEVKVLDKDGKEVANPAPAKPSNPIAQLLAPILPSSSQPTSQHAMQMPSGDTPPGGGMSGMGDQSGAASSDSSTAPAPYPYAPAADPVSGASDPFVKHLQAAHLSKGPGQQVQDIAEFDFWAKTHEALIRQMLEYEIGKDSVLGTTPVMDTFLKHMDATHFNQSPMEQASAISDFDSWNKTHLALFRLMLDPFVGKQSQLGKAPMTGVFMQHMDAAHWSKSLNGQATDITDDLPAWIATHQALIEAMIASAQTPGSNH